MKLVKKSEGWYNLYDGEVGIGSTHEELQQPYKLSVTNCDAIFGIFDVENLACEEIRIHIDAYKSIHGKSTEKGASPCTPLNEGGCVGANLYSQVNGFIKGFNKAMELKEDKFFTLDDIYTVFIMGRENKEHEMNRYVDRIHEPTEIEVEIVKKSIGRVKLGVGSSLDQMMPRLDSDGCLILKKI